jgi:hypothetical protein
MRTVRYNTKPRPYRTPSLAELAIAAVLVGIIVGLFARLT